MSNTPTTTALEVYQLPDYEIEDHADILEKCCDIGGAAILRDYVRLRKLVNAVIDRIKRYRENPENPMCAFNDIKIMVAEAEKGESK